MCQIVTVECVLRAVELQATMNQPEILSHCGENDFRRTHDASILHSRDLAQGGAAGTQI